MIIEVGDSMKKLYIILRIVSILLLLRCLDKPIVEISHTSHEKISPKMEKRLYLEYPQDLSFYFCPKEKNEKRRSNFEKESGLKQYVSTVHCYGET